MFLTHNINNFLHTFEMEMAWTFLIVAGYNQPRDVRKYRDMGYMGYIRCICYVLKILSAGYKIFPNTITIVQ